MLEEMQGFRLSPQQRNLWTWQEVDQSSYCSQCAILIEGELKINTLKQALEKLVDRHEILRTNFQCLSGMSIPLQVITNNNIVWGENYDFSSYNHQEQAELLSNLFNQFRQQPFDLQQGCMLRVSLVNLSIEKNILLIALPALCADATTLKILVREISQSYLACLQNTELDNEPLQYADLAEWQNELLESEDTEAGRDYWRKQNIATLSDLKLPWEKQTTSKSTFKPQVQSINIAPEILTQLETLVQQYNISVSDFLLTCWEVLLWRITQEQNLVIGTACDGRKYEELTEAIGLFTRYLPISLAAKPESKFSDLLINNHPNIQEATKFYDYFSWDKISTLNTNTSQFLPFSFEFLEQSHYRTNSEIYFSIYHYYSCTEKFKIKLVCTLYNHELKVELYYDSILFDFEYIQAITRQLQTLISSAVNHPETEISELEIISDTELTQLLKNNNNQQAYPNHLLIHQLFEIQVEKTPHQIAIVFEDEQLTYQQLNQKANQLAHYLQKQGVKPEILVGLCLERSIDMIVSILGILKAGAAYVPFDSAIPTKALASRLKDVQASFLISNSCVANKLADVTNQEQILVICLDTDWEKIAEESNTNPSSQVNKNNLAYVLFTSGSTGQPKGVAIEHQQLINYVYGIIYRLNLPINSGYNFALVSTLAADLGNTVIYPALCTGGCLHIISYDCATDPILFTEYCQKYPIDCLKIVPSHLSSLLLSSSPQSILPRQRLILGGEATNWQLIEKIRQYAPDCLIFNHYGPTESTVGILTYLITEVEEVDLHTKTVPLGQPIANTQVYILDHKLQLAPIGIIGEIYIGGAGLARCYMPNPELTAERFIPDPFSNKPGARLYKTGDLARYLPDGKLEFIGRKDDQVKIRGFRIELAEIEAILTQHSQVREAVVVARETESGDKRLVGYIVTVNSENIDLSELNNFLKQNLPDYMLPSAWAILENLPLTSNGKINRQALPTPEEIIQQKKGTITPPRTPVEEVLAGIWVKILGVKRVGIEENFFELGGHSLLATQVMSQIRAAFKVELPLRSLFESPTVAELAERIENSLSNGEKLTALQIAKITQKENLPLSFAQQRLWFLDQLQPGSPVYNLSRAVKLQGELNINALEKSFNVIIQRHEALRTAFHSLDGEPVQVIIPEVNIKLPVVDLRNLSPEERQIETQNWFKIQAQHSFDLTQAPLLNISLLQLAEQEYILLFTIHHIIADGWSAGVIIRELAVLYESFCINKPVELPSLPIQYADFTVWQRQWLQTEVLADQMQYWKQQLSGDLPVLELPIAKPRPKHQTVKGKKHNFILSPSLTNELKTLSQTQGVTLFMTLLAAFKTLLYRYTGQEDILIGSPIANRNRSEIEGLIGFFVNTLVLRTSLAENPSFSELLKRVREVTLGAYTHQDLPFELLVEELQPQRNLNYTPLFQVMFALQNAPREELKLSELKGEYLPIENDTARFDLSLAFTDDINGLIGELEYNTYLLDADSIERMLGHFSILLADIVENPEKPLSDLAILTPAEQQQILKDWNHTEADYPDVCVQELFAAQVAKTPDAIAVVAGEESLTYQQLNEQANQLANYLNSLGVGKEVLVGVCSDRSPSMIIALLAILKAGGAYIPLDPTYPQERLAYMLEDSQLSILLTQQKFLTVLPPSNAQVICIDQDWKHISKQTPIENITQPDNLPDNLIYTIYTSGSTGKPKGVQITHRSVVNFLTAMQQQLQLTPQDSLLSVTTLSFDIAVLELFLPLTVGAKVILVSRETATDGLKLLQQLDNHNVTFMQATPATWRMLLDAEWEGNKQLKILCGGEALSPNLAAQLHQKVANIWNVYGPTETTIWSTIHPVNDQKTIVPIGRPIANTQIYILDQNLQPVPVGVPGELYIGGVGLARGYFQQSELTKQKFISNPFNPDTLIYKTGDLARYLHNGEIECLGRIDYQIKLRGFRIELGEIEAVLEQHPAVRQSVVIVREDVPGNQHLVAYLVAEDSVIKELPQYLRQKLPEYMIPSAFVTLKTMPLTPNGKVNRRALPVPDDNQEFKNNWAAPRNPVEEVLVGIWTQILGVSQIGIDDNFFALGGHSLLATQVISRIRKIFGIEIPLQRLFELPTIAELAPTIHQRNNKRITVISSVNRDRHLPLSFAQSRLWLLEQLNPSSGIYNMPAAVRLVGKLNVEALEKSINEIIRRHEVLRTSFLLENGQLLQVVVPQLQLKIPIIDLQKFPKFARDTEIQRLSIEEYQKPFDLTKSPLLRCTLLHLSAEEYILLFTIHHIVFDGWSIGILIQELSILYTAFIAGQLSLLPDLPIQYADFAAWQRQYLQDENLENLLTYWKQQLTNLPVLKLPTKQPREQVKTNRGASYSFVISGTVAQELKQLSQQENVTLFMTLLASFKILLQRYTNQDDIIVGTDVANRNQSELEPLIGFFVNLLVLRTDLSGNPTFQELLQRVRTQILSAYAHQDLPFDELVRELQPERHLNNAVPLFQVLFVLQNTPTSDLELPGLTLNLLELETKTARFDLALFLTETKQGIVGKWQYNADLFAEDTITRMTNNWQTLINNIVQQPQNRINTLEILTAAEKAQQTMQQQERKAAKKQKFMNIAPKVVNLSVEQLIKTDYLQEGQKFPLIIQPNTVEVDLISWVENNREYLEIELLKHGAILLRGFNVKSVSEFESVAQTICPHLFAEYGDLPRTGEGGKVYGSTPYPADKAILFHNESSHLHCFPLKIWFYCVQPAAEGGETPIVDCRKAYKLLSPELREKLATKQLMYVRNYAEGLDVSWQNFFQTTDKKEVENYCIQAGMEFEWYSDNGLVTRQIRPALAVHPKTGESVFFNQIQLHHISYLDPEVRESLLSIFGESKLPRNVYFGDGTPITEQEITEINDIYQQSQTSFTWQKGDIIMLDNMLAAHGRNPYIGQRKIVVAMAEMINGSDIQK
ncbi:MAG TPA: amino acid adenylation domain-containing protein [Nostocaceae cyanobacterium]|nr:amino acid adenylation domain-containing protein [Nostocaceae cyanobacterium]